MGVVVVAGDGGDGCAEAFEWVDDESAQAGEGPPTKLGRPSLSNALKGFLGFPNAGPPGPP